VRAAINNAGEMARMTLNRRRPSAAWDFSFWFVILSPLLGILLAMLVLWSFAD